LIDPEYGGPNGNGNPTSLLEAIEIAEEGTVIKLCEGVYTNSIRITKPGLKFEPRDKDKPVYIIGNEGPVVTVDLKDNEYVVFKKILMAHSGINISTK
jgi:hypothetical protein